MSKTAIIAGATGLTGKFLLQLLIDSEIYSSVKVITRKTLDLNKPKVQEIITDFNTIDNFKHLLVADDVFCCLGTTIKKAKTKDAFKIIDMDYPLRIATLCKENKASQYLLISSMGANPNSLIFYPKVKGMLEEELKKIGFDGLHIFRPSLLLGKRQEFRFGEYLGTAIYKLFAWTLIGKLKKYKGIKAEAVAFGMFKQAQLNLKGIHIYESDKIAYL